MWTRAELKEKAKINFKRLYKQSVIVCIIVYLLGAIFDGGYNSTSNRVENSVTYNQSQDSGDIYENDAFDEEFNLENKTHSVSEFTEKYSIGGVIENFFEFIFNSIYNLFSGISMAIIVVISICIALIGVVLKVLIFNPIIIGKNNFFMGIREDERKVGDIFFLFKNSKFIKPAITIFFVDLFTLLWTLLLIIPGIIKHYQYFMIEYILSENPDIDRKRAFELSKYMMDGQILETFVLDLSFIGWDILSSITFGLVGIFYVNPYRESTYAELYATLREEAIQNGFTDVNELPGFKTVL
ncbi:DUF975 family protein [Romboutsia lituseburensis]|uniref:DUF975 family protein n=1 Tax=Romboutsia lituseburensis DSM 797 TaxID=1121325 RepID=A0A1G9IPK1_9FIRM|nr:DUF975 family protein [Romboutsia lituseburensis]CEH33812.1 Protein of unknown function (DUF975) [Romboutsia lituseburensis]SDL27071.1 Protein of unknown function [Romboutsia lituseburensis DSM 797]